jgi:hypothetical protein
MFLGSAIKLGDVSEQSWALPHGRAMGFYLRQSYGFGPQQSWGLRRDGATMHNSQLSWERALQTLAPHDLVTCCQARGLSGHTSL